ncbi:MAG: hypothetical protein JWN58_1855 [Gammaproteobacteria bacterium]|nr:hypothetical protein [Gammaproteobacteria bacterium]
MRIHIGLAALAGIFLSAWAASPQKPPATAGVAPTVVAAAVQTSSSSYDPRVAAAQKRAREMGYHSEVRHGEQYFCRTIAPLGSRLTQKECLNVDTMEEAARMADENKRSVQQMRNCQGPGCTIN